MISDILCSFSCLKTATYFALCLHDHVNLYPIFIFVPRGKNIPLSKAQYGVSIPSWRPHTVTQKKSRDKGKERWKKMSMHICCHGEEQKYTLHVALLIQFILLQEQNCRNVRTSCGGTRCVLDKRCYWTPENAQLHALRFQLATESRVMWLLQWIYRL